MIFFYLSYFVEYRSEYVIEGGVSKVKIMPHLFLFFFSVKCFFYVIITILYTYTQHSHFQKKLVLNKLHEREQETCSTFLHADECVCWTPKH